MNDTLMAIQRLQDISNAYYINLDDREDRKRSIESQLGTLGLKCLRYSAIKRDNGAIGCTMSHLNILKRGMDLGWDHVLILEDDILFMNPALFSWQFAQFMKSGIEWDVVLFAGNVVELHPDAGATPTGNFCKRVSKCQTTTGYLVNGHYIPTLFDNVKEGLARLIREPHNHVMHAIDKHWFWLQTRDNWYIIHPPTVIQSPGYSDIEQRYTDYSQHMLNFTKHVG